MELGAVPLVVATALRTGLPYAIVRKAPKGHGTNQRLEGEIPAGAPVLVIEDVTTSAAGRSWRRSESLRGGPERVSNAWCAWSTGEPARPRSCAPSG